MKQDRFYWNGKQYVPSGTTVLPRPYLATWAAGCVVDYIKQEAYQSVTNERWHMSGLDFDDVLSEACTAFERESMQAADYGTYIHAVCQYSLQGNMKLESPHEMTQAFMDGLWAWKEKHNVKVIAMEHEVVTDTYGGRLDLVCEMDSFWMTKAWCKRLGHKWYKGIEKRRVIVLVDFKTGKGTYYDTWKYQLCGYVNGWKWGTQENPYLPIKHHGILKFNKKTTKVNYKDFTKYEATRTNPVTLEKEKYIRTYKEDLNTFMACVRLWWAKNRGIVV